jgi:hypothetical protein
VGNTRSTRAPGRAATIVSAGAAERVAEVQRPLRSRTGRSSRNFTAMTLAIPPAGSATDSGLGCT